MQTEKKILQAIAEYLGVSGEDLDKESSLREDLGLGSLELNDLLNDLSSQFNISFNPEDVEELKRVADLVALVEDNLIE